MPCVFWLSKSPKLLYSMKRYTVTLTPGDKVYVSLYGDSTALFPKEIKVNHYLIKWQLLTCRGANMKQLCPSSARNWKTSCRCRNRNASKLVSVAVLQHHVEKTFHLTSPSATVWFFADICETCFKGIFWYYVFHRTWNERCIDVVTEFVPFSRLS